MTKKERQQYLNRRLQLEQELPNEAYFVTEEEVTSPNNVNNRESAIVLHLQADPCSIAILRSDSTGNTSNLELMYRRVDAPNVPLNPMQKKQLDVFIEILSINFKLTHSN